GAAPIPGDLWVQASGEQILLGLFKDLQKTDYLMVVNCDGLSERTATLNMDPAVTGIERMDPKTGKWT
ncbi:MAG: hypothetical protein GWO24_37810, partial [Akkermansiaceae bacterium]|nr:hypothetical protein [Akkermansiaceae bacterium]